MRILEAWAIGSKIFNSKTGQFKIYEKERQCKESTVIVAAETALDANMVLGEAKWVNGENNLNDLSPITESDYTEYKSDIRGIIHS